MDESKRRLNFLENVLPKLILEENDDLKHYSIVKCSASDSTKLDGFMSMIFHIELELQDKKYKSSKTLSMVAKVMKGDEKFRESAKSYIMCSNEVHIYKNVIPAFRRFLKNSITTFNPDEWIPRAYFADCKKFPDFCDSEEALLVLENLQKPGYRLGPRIDLDEPHLRLMIRNIAQYHSVCHAMKITKNPELQPLIDAMKPLSFLDNKGEVLPSYNRLFEIGLKRVFNYVDATSAYQKDPDFVRMLNIMNVKYGKLPAVMMQKFLKPEEPFSVLLHGDYNRNNVLFQYDKDSGFDNPKSLRMIDFQETRYATCVIDLAFFMYMNMPDSIRAALWDKLLQYYHETLIESLCDILKCKNDDDRLKPYSLDKFLEHFTKFAFYGTIIVVHFIPWMACSEEECQQLSDCFDKDMNSERMAHLAEVCGGVEVSERVMSVVKHSFEKGYMKFLEELN